MIESVKRCSHADVEICVCDCGREVVVCLDCLADKRVVSCGQCGIEEAINPDDREDSIVYARRAAILKREIAEQQREIAVQQREIAEQQREAAELRARIQDESILERFLNSKNDDLKREIDEGEEWKG